MQKINLDTIFKNSTEICTDIQENNENKKIIVSLLTLIFLCTGLYGLVMGSYHSWQQSLSSFFKVPLLYLLTLFVCIPTLHFAGLFLGSGISFFQSVSIMLLGIATNSAFLLGFTTISVFFYITGSDYRFLLLMHVLFFAVGGIAGLISINRSYNFLSARLDGSLKKNGTHLLRIWMLLYMFVGTQMAYILSPFVGKDETFYLFHHPKGNFYTYVMDLMLDKFSDEELDPKKAEDLVSDKAETAITSLKEKNFVRLATLIGSGGLKVVLNSAPSAYSQTEIDPKLSAAALLEAFEKNSLILIKEKNLSDPNNPFREMRIPFSQLYTEYLYDYDYASRQISPNFNVFTVGREHKQKLRTYYPRAVFVEYPSPKKDGHWTALRLVFEQSASGYQLTAVIHDKSSK